MKFRTLPIVVLIIIGFLLMGSLFLVAIQAAANTPSSLNVQSATPTSPPPPIFQTPVDEVYAPIVIDVVSPPTATRSPDVTPTVYITPTFPSP